MDADREEGDGHEHRCDQAPVAGDLHPGPGEAEQGRQQGEGGDHGHGHRDGSAVGQAPHEGEPHQQHAEQRDHDSHAGEQHGPAGGGHRRGGGGLEVGAVVDLLPPPGDDEQGVVDAHTEPDHGGQEAGEVGHLGEVAEQGQQRHSRADAEQSDPDR
ncbi:MAG: hypothetical protein R2761_16000 [Acidimicrobiales bacterium]